MTLEERVIRVVAESLGIGVQKIDVQTSSADITEWDSIGRMAILVAISDEFGVELAPNEMSMLDSIESIVALARVREMEE